MNPYRTTEVNEIEKNEYRGHLFAISRLNLYGVSGLMADDINMYECLCIHCGKSININKLDNKLYNPAFSLHFSKQCFKTTRVRWELNKILTGKIGSYYKDRLDK